MKRTDLQSYLDRELRVAQFKDYCPNGLQVEGRDEVNSILCAATANLDLCRMAAAQNFDAILCHHGFFWRGEPPELTGVRRQRVATLLGSEVNLFAYHLPLDVHPLWGNNVALAERMGWQIDQRLAAGGVDELLCLGHLPQPLTVAELSGEIHRRLERQPLVVGSQPEDGRRLSRIAWCTGAAEDFIVQAADFGAEAYISGEISLAITDLANELNICYLAAGHHATERYGVQKLANHLQEKFQLRVNYCEQDNPV